MEGETKIETSSGVQHLLEPADCDALERHIAKLDARFARARRPAPARAVRSFPAELRLRKLFILPVVVR